MPESGAQPEPGRDRLDVGDGVAATVYRDGRVVFWNDRPAPRAGGLHPAGVDRPRGGGAGQGRHPGPGRLDRDVPASPTRPRSSPAPIPSDAPPGPGPAPPAPSAAVNPRDPTGPVGTRNPGEDFNYGPYRPGNPGQYPTSARGADPTSPATRHRPAGDPPGPAARAGGRSAPAPPDIPTAGACPASARTPSRSARTTWTTCTTPGRRRGTSPAPAPTTSTC